jgi:hypothetical protein
MKGQLIGERDEGLDSQHVYFHEFFASIPAINTFYSPRLVPQDRSCPADPAPRREAPCRAWPGSDPPAPESQP